MREAVRCSRRVRERDGATERVPEHRDAIEAEVLAYGIEVGRELAHRDRVGDTAL